jgi:hypothetical protein
MKARVGAERMRKHSCMAHIEGREEEGRGEAGGRGGAMAISGHEAGRSSNEIKERP